MSRWHITRYAKPNGTMTATAHDNARAMREWIWDKLSPVRTGTNLTTCRMLVNSIGNPLLYVTELVVAGHRFSISLSDVIPADVKLAMAYDFETHTFEQPPLFQEPPC